MTIYRYYGNIGKQICRYFTMNKSNLSIIVALKIANNDVLSTFFKVHFPKWKNTQTIVKLVFIDKTASFIIDNLKSRPFLHLEGKLST